jgi:hypothetical protein
MSAVTDPPRRYRSTDWTCPNCTQRNSGWADECGRCGLVWPADRIGEPPAGPRAPCGLCGDAIRWTDTPGAFWESPPDYVEDMPFHTGCLHPEVIVVTAPLDGKTTPNIRVGRLLGFSPGRDGWWLTLADTLTGYVELSMNWSRVIKVVLRHER